MIKKVLIAADSFKGSLTSHEVVHIIAGVLKKYGMHVLAVPVTDGGDGVLDVLRLTSDLKYAETEVIDATGEMIKAGYLIDENMTGYLSVSSASGIQDIDRRRLDPFKASTYGTGQILEKMISSGIKNVKFFLGGSATVDGGTGILSALGAEFYDKSGSLIDAAVENPLIRFKNMIPDKALTKLKELNVELIVDVDNEITGEAGAVKVFGPQKGVNENSVELFCEKMNAWVDMLEQISGKKLTSVNGLGAAGGAGLPLFSFSDCKVVNGAEWFYDFLDLGELISGVDIVITGEGSIDRQTFMGKIPGLIATKAKAAGKTVIGICGKTDGTVSGRFDELIAIISEFNVTEEYSQRHASGLLRKAAELIADQLI